MVKLNPYTTTKGNRYDLIYYEDTKIAEATCTTINRTGSRGPVVSVKIEENEDPRSGLIEELEKGNF